MSDFDASAFLDSLPPSAIPSMDPVPAPPPTPVTGVPPATGTGIDVLAVAALEAMQDEDRTAAQNLCSFRMSEDVATQTEGQAVYVPVDDGTLTDREYAAVVLQAIGGRPRDYVSKRLKSRSAMEAQATAAEKRAHEAEEELEVAKRKLNERTMELDATHARYVGMVKEKDHSLAVKRSACAALAIQCHQMASSLTGMWQEPSASAVAGPAVDAVAAAAVPVKAARYHLCKAKCADGSRCAFVETTERWNIKSHFPVYHSVPYSAKDYVETVWLTESQAQELQRKWEEQQRDSSKKVKK